MEYYYTKDPHAPRKIVIDLQDDKQEEKEKGIRYRIDDVIRNVLRQGGYDDPSQCTTHS